MLEAAFEENRAPTLAVITPEFKVVFLACHPRDHVADAAPVIEALVQKPQLGLRRFKREEAERGA
jgi:hypothetical protein